MTEKKQILGNDQKSAILSTNDKDGIFAMSSAMKFVKPWMTKQFFK